MSQEEIKKILAEQLKKLSEKSQKDMSCTELAWLSEAMGMIANSLASYSL